MSKRIVIVGGGLAGVTAAWQLTQLGQQVALHESSDRLGGTIETVHRNGFVIELGPDGWITEKPWAAQLAEELGLGHELIASNDEGRVTYIVRDGELIAMPDGMRMMVPTNLSSLEGSSLFTADAIAAYTAEIEREHELLAAAPIADESVAGFVLRHFGHEVLHRVAAPLLSGVFGGDVFTLSVQAVMPAFVHMEREHGSLITALRTRVRTTQRQPIFTTLRSGTQSLIDRMAAALPKGCVRLNSPVASAVADGSGWSIEVPAKPHTGNLCDHLILATPAHVTQTLLPEVDQWLPHEASSAINVVLAFDETFDLPKGFGFLAPEGESELLACTFTDQKFCGRAPAGKRLIRAFFGGHRAESLQTMDDKTLASLALHGLREILGPFPVPAFSIVRRWSRSLPQYAVGHLERMAELDRWVEKQRTLHLLGNAYRGVGLPDLIRDARALGHRLAAL